MAIAAAVLAGVGAAQAQTTVIERAPAETRTVVVGPALQLTPVQRETIYRTIVRTHVAPPPTVAYRIGAPVPQGARLYRVPQSVAVAVPAVKAYRYMVVNGEVLLVDPTTSEVVATLSD